MEAPDLTKRPQSLTRTARLINFGLHWLVWLALWIKGVDFKVANMKGLPKKGPLVLACAPHMSLADSIFMIASIRRRYVGIGMAELLTDEWPWIVRKGFALLGHIPIVRGNAESGKIVSDCAVHALSHGQALVIWPEGMQIEPGKDAVWFPGFARYAIQTGALIYVFKIEGADAFWPTHPGDGGPQEINWKAKVRAAFSNAIDPHDYATVDELIAATRRIHAELPVPA